MPMTERSSLPGIFPSLVTLPAFNGLTSKLPAGQKRVSQRRKGDSFSDSSTAWHQLPQQEMTPENMRELRALQLRPYTSSRSMYNSSDVNLPQKFEVGRIIEGGLRPVGGGKESQAAGVPNKKRKAGKSLVDELLHDEDVKHWTRRKCEELEKRAAAAKPMKFRRFKKQRRRQ